MDHLAERPAVPPEESGGDERAGLLAAGAVLIVLGYGLGVIANLYLHVSAGGGSVSIGPWTVTSALGPFALATLAIGLGTGSVGAAFLAIGRRLPKGPIVLPGKLA